MDPAPAHGVAIFGLNLRDNPLLHAVAFAAWPKQFLSTRFQRLGEGFTITLPGLGEIVVTCTPAGCKELFSAPSEQFASLQNSPVEPILGPDSLMLVSGHRHLEERRMLAQPFRGENMRAYGQSIAEDTLKNLPQGQFVAQDVARDIALDVIIGCVFGVQEPAKKSHFHAAISRMMDRYTTPLMVMPLLRFGFFGISPWDRFLQSRHEVHSLFREEFQREGLDESILGRLLALDPRPSEISLLSLLCTLLVAGHDTSAIGITWALYYLHKYPSTLERLRDEIQGKDTPDELAGSPFLKAVCQETLRLNPSVPATIRRVQKPFLFLGQERPVGSNVGVSLTVLHSDPELYPDPHEFKPERFLERKFSPFEYAPFGGGYRRCIGETFATYEMSIVLGTLISNARFELLPQKEPRAMIKGIAMGPSRPVRFLSG